MPANVNLPEDWESIIDLIRQGDDSTAKQLLIERERRMDAFFTSFSVADFTPVLYQNGAAVASTVPVVEGFRIGPYVWYKGSVVANAAGTAGGYVSIGLPPFLPQVAPSAVTYACGVLSIYDQSAPQWFNATAVQSSAIIANHIAGLPHNNSNVFQGQVGAPFAAALAAGDFISWAIQYKTSAVVS